MVTVFILDSIVGRDPETGRDFQYGKGATAIISDALAADLIRAGHAKRLEKEAPNTATKHHPERRKK